MFLLLALYIKLIYVQHRAVSFMDGLKVSRYFNTRLSSQIDELFPVQSLLLFSFLGITDDFHLGFFFPPSIFSCFVDLVSVGSPSQAKEKG